MSDNRPPRYVETNDDGTERVIYRASALGMCDRIFVALANGYDPMAHPAWFQEVLDEGTDSEAAIRQMYQDEYPEHGQVIDTQRVVEMEILEDVWVRGSIDGFNGDLFEAKKFRDSTWQKFLRSGVEAQKNYPMQTAFYIHALREEEGNDDIGMHFVGGRYSDGEIKEIHVKGYSDPAVPLLAIRKRVAKLEALINAGNHPTDVPCQVPAMYPCPFYYLHDADDAYEPPERPGDDVIAPLLKERAELSRREAEAKAIFNPNSKEVKDAIKRINDGIVAWCEVSGVPDGEPVTVRVDDVEYDVKTLGMFRKGYTVDDATYTKVTIKAREEAGKATLKKSAKKTATKGPSK